MLLPAARLVDTVRPLEGAGRWIRVLPFAAIAATGLILAATAPPSRPGAVLVGVGVLVLIIAVTALPWQRWDAGWQAVPALGYYAVAALLAYAAGERIDFYFLTALPIIWLALFHTRDLMFLGLGLLALVLFIPPWVLPDAHPGHPWGMITMAFALSCLGGVAGQQLVSRTRAAAAGATAALRRARADRDLLNAYLNTAGCLVTVLDRAGRVTLFNRFCEEVTGYPAQQAIGRAPWSLVVHPGEARAAFDRVLTHRSPVTFEDDILTRTGKRRRVTWTGTGLTDETGHVTHVIATGLDITEQRATERLFANVLSAVTEQMIVAVDTDGRFTVFNAGGERLLGYAAAEVVGATMDDIALVADGATLTAEFGVSTFRELIALAAPQTPTFTREWTLVRKDGATVPVSMTISPMRDGDAVRGYVAVARDITAEREAAAAAAAALEWERQAAARLRELDQVKSDFVAAVSHDLRTPLTAIVGNLELILDPEAEPVTPTQRLLLEAVGRNSQRLRSLVGDLLMLSRIESGTLRLRARTVSLGEVVTGALEALAAERASDVRLEVEVPATPALVQGDLEQLERVIINLVSNALKFTPPGGRVVIAVSVDADHVRLRVSDTGIGIAPAELPHIFNRFYRSTADADRPGAGLGLTIVKSIVELHGGTVHVSSAPAHGTTFLVELPRLASPAENTQREPA